MHWIPLERYLVQIPMFTNLNVIVQLNKFNNRELRLLHGHASKAACSNNVLKKGCFSKVMKIILWYEITTCIIVTNNTWSACGIKMVGTGARLGSLVNAVIIWWVWDTYWHWWTIKFSLFLEISLFQKTCKSVFLPSFQTPNQRLHYSTLANGWMPYRESMEQDQV